MATEMSLMEVPDNSSDPAGGMAKRLPSGSQLPFCWNQAMDRALCHMEAQNEVEPRTMVRLMKRRFPELERHVIPIEAIERRLLSLDLQDNDYFKSGMELAVAAAERDGFEMPLFDPTIYPYRIHPHKSDLEVYGSGSPMTGTLGFGASNVSESEPTGRFGKLSIGDKSRTPETTTPAIRASPRNEAINSIRRVQIAGEYVHPYNLTDIRNTRNAPGLPVTPNNYGDEPPTGSSSNHTIKAVSPGLPVTPLNSRDVQYFQTLSSKDKYRKNDATRETAGSPARPSNPTGLGIQHFPTPSSRDKDRKVEPRKAVRTPNFPPPKNRSNNSKDEAFEFGTTADKPTRGLYRSDKENATSGMSLSTTGTSILGRESSSDMNGMRAAMDRRHAKVDHRLNLDD